MSDRSESSDFPPAGTAVTQILVVSDAAGSRDFWTGVMGAELVRQYGGTSVVLRFAGAWILLVTGGAPTADKPSITLAPPADPDLVASAMTLRIPDCWGAYRTLTARGAEFLTPPHDWGAEIRCYLRDPDGHLIELSEARG
jgi:catechol 2,3-dioxygenase-like lactoylglutathione lyase family enzyme